VLSSAAVFIRSGAEMVVTIKGAAKENTMSWDQEYQVPSLQDLLEKIAGISGTQLLIDHLEAKGLNIVDVEDLLLDDGFMQDVRGAKVAFSDGRVYIPKLIERFNENGNHGIDIYDWRLIGDEPEVQYINADTTDPNVDEFTVPANYGLDEPDHDSTDCGC
jgi:hypothetical protein